MKTGLVLEGGGMRGAYTAGALTWLIDHDVSFYYGAGISSGAVYLCAFEEKRKDILYHLSCNYTTDKDCVGIRALQREGYYVGYRKLMKHYLKDTDHMTVQPLKDRHANIEIGVYDLEQGKTIWFTPDDMDEDLELLRAACSLPIISETVEYRGKKLLDGGITKMIPIERAVEKECDRYFIITTKPADYVRKPGPKAVNLLMRTMYRDYPQVAKDYAVRHLNYYKQIDIINELTFEGKAMHMRPSQTIKVSRFSGDPEKLRQLYELGIHDMEEKKEEILAFIKGE